MEDIIGILLSTEDKVLLTSHIVNREWTVHDLDIQTQTHWSISSKLIQLIDYRSVDDQYCRSKNTWVTAMLQWIYSSPVTVRLKLHS